MTYVRSFDGFYPPARFDGLPFTAALIQEAAVIAGPYTTLETIALNPLDADPANPAARDLTTALAALANGWYRIVWRDAAAAEFAGDPVPFPAGAATDLCTVTEVRERRSTAANHVSQDPLVARVIASVSAAIARQYEREFTPTAGAARTFEYAVDDDVRLSLTPYDLRTITQLRVNPDQASPTILEADQYRLQPYPSEHGTYTAIRFRPGVMLPDASWGATLVEITGDWGFATIPDDVREAAIVSVVHNMRTTVGQYSVADGAGGETRYERVEIPQAARDLLDPFRRMS